MGTEVFGGGVGEVGNAMFEGELGSQGRLVLPSEDEEPSLFVGDGSKLHSFDYITNASMSLYHP